MYRNRFADVLKGILIIFVIVLHSDITQTSRQVAGFPFWVNMAVPMFMLISGYVSALSLEKHGVNAVEKAYEPLEIIRKLLRFVIPFSIAFFAQWIVFRVAGLYQVSPIKYGLFALLMDYIQGGKGPGSYYFPVMIQFIFVFPAIYYVIKKYTYKGLGACFIANGVLEVVKIAFGVSGEEYRLLLFRYLFVIACGCYVAVGNLQELKKGILFGGAILCVVIGLGFTYLFSYTGYVPKILIYWKETSFVTNLYLLPLMAWMLTKMKCTFAPLEYIGKASFNIFLVQMIYYIFGEKMAALIPNLTLRVIVNILFCVGIGVVFYVAESKLTGFVLGKVIIKKNK